MNAIHTPPNHAEASRSPRKALGRVHPGRLASELETMSALIKERVANHELLSRRPCRATCGCAACRDLAVAGVLIREAASLLKRSAARERSLYVGAVTLS